PRRPGRAAFSERLRHPGQELVRPGQRAPAASALPRQLRAGGTHPVPRAQRLPARRRLCPRPRGSSGALGQDGPGSQCDGDRPQETVHRDDDGPVRPLRCRGEALRHRPRGRPHPQRARGLPHAPAPSGVDRAEDHVDPVGAMAIQAILVALKEWHRKSELSADRAGLLACQDPDAAKRALMKLAGGSNLSEMNPDAFMEQAREYEQGGDAVDSVLKLMATVPASHPFAVVRVAEVQRWVESGEYQQILDGEYPRRGQDRDSRISDEAGRAADSYRDEWNRTKDPLVSVVRDVADGAAGAGGRIFDSVAERWRGSRQSGNSKDDDRS